ncbi:MAG TPA: hypothetical protein VEY07_00575, partial [Thermoplasmata archaeon]|nr:hypothetical protein [Thermoplasmata archaeon]
GPRYYSDPNAVTVAARPRPSGPKAGQARPPLVCSNCGTSNEPWLTVCRKCKRALLTTGTT